MEPRCLKAIATLVFAVARATSIQPNLKIVQAWLDDLVSANLLTAQEREKVEQIFMWLVEHVKNLPEDEVNLTLAEVAAKAPF